MNLYRFAELVMMLAAGMAIIVLGNWWLALLMVMPIFMFARLDIRSSYGDGESL